MESNPYLEARRQWDERYADLVLGKRNRQIAGRSVTLAGFAARMTKLGTEYGVALYERLRPDFIASSSLVWHLHPTRLRVRQLRG